MASIIELLTEELEEAVQVKNKKSLHRYVTLLVESMVPKGKYVSESGSIHSDIQILTETVLEGFKRMDQRFEASDRRFEDLQNLMNARFEASQNQMDARFEASDKRFDDLHNQMNDRFEAQQNQVNDRFEALQNQVNTVFEASDKRFELSQSQMSARFEDVNRRFNMMFTFMTVGFAALTILVSLYKFIVP